MAQCNTILTIVQADSRSTQPADILMRPLAGRPLIFRILERIQAAKLSGRPVVATTTRPEDDKIDDYCRQEGFEVYRGHSDDLLERYYQAGSLYNADIVIKIPSSCPLIDPEIIDVLASALLDAPKHYDYASNLHPPTYPDGNDVEVMTMDALAKARELSSKTFERKNTTPFIWENPGSFNNFNVEWQSGLDYSLMYRLTVEYEEDYKFARAIYDALYKKNNLFGLKEILNFLEFRPDIASINAMYTGGNWRRHHMSGLNKPNSEPINI
jgi:spore coat polysaccharide biosynthesis protein SpsF